MHLCVQVYVNYLCLCLRKEIKYIVIHAYMYTLLDWNLNMVSKNKQIDLNFIVDLS